MSTMRASHAASMVSWPTRSEEGLVANSGRVLLVETSAADIKAAQDKVYAIIDKLDTKGMFYRHDIGFKALNA